MLGLRWQDVDFEAGRLLLKHNLWRRQLVTPKTKARARVIHLPQGLADVLRAHREVSPWKDSTDYVFARLDGTPYDPDHMRNQVLYPVLDRCGIERRKFEHGCHLFRHTAGSLVHAASRDLKMTQELLGHTRISTTADIYVHLPERVAQEATEILARELVGELVVPEKPLLKPGPHC